MKPIKEWKSWVKVLMVVIIVLLLTVVAVVAMYAYAKHQLSKVERVDKKDEVTTIAEKDTEDLVKSDSSEEKPDLSEINKNILGDDEIKNILIIGQDRRENEDKSKKTRSDTMIICSLNSKTNQINLVSLMRDMYVPIPGYSSNRLNSAYSTGGMELLDATIAQDFGVKIDGNVEVDFDAFLKVASELAPVEIELTEAEAEYMNTYPLDDVDIASQKGGWNFHEGVNTLYQGAMLEYSRMRYVGHSDWERTDRQRKLLATVFEKLKSENVFSLLDIAGKVAPSLVTDMTDKEIMSYIYAVYNNKMTIASSNRAPKDGTYTSQNIRGMSVLVPDLQENAKYIQDCIYGRVLNAVTVVTDETDETDEEIDSEPESEGVTQIQSPVTRVETTPTPEATKPNTVEEPSPEVAPTPEPTAVPTPEVTEPSTAEEPVPTPNGDESGNGNEELGSESSQTPTDDGSEVSEGEATTEG